MDFYLLKLPVKQRTQVTNALRKIWKNSPGYQEKKKSLLVNKMESRCEKCLQVFHKKLIELDHIEPIGGLIRECKGDINRYLERLMEGKLQGLCVYCHQEKTHGKKNESEEPESPKKPRSKKKIKGDLSFLE